MKFENFKVEKQEEFIDEVKLMTERLENEFDKMLNDLKKHYDSIGYKYNEEKIKNIFQEKISQVNNRIGIRHSKEGITHSGVNDEGPFVGMGGNKIISSDRLKKITAAHESGHFIRQSLYYPDNFDFDALDKEKSDLFNKLLEPFNFSDVVAKQHLEGLKNISDFEDVNLEDVKSYLSNPLEIIERMAQLKNYFKMSGGEEFTLEDFKYAKENYIKDFAQEKDIMTIQMEWFFNAIEDEELFVENMNNMAV